MALGFAINSPYLYVLIPLIPVSALILLRYPPFQRLFVFLYWAKIPLFIQPLDAVVQGRKNIHIPSSNGAVLGVWLSNNPESDPKTFVLYLHGNGGTRGQSRRVQQSIVLRKIFRANFVSFDYRGFGDSSGTPCEDSVLDDAIVVWNYIVDELQAERIIIWGHSLGTGVGCKLAEVVAPHSSAHFPSKLHKQKEMVSEQSTRKLHSLFLEAPFESIRTAAETHWLSFPLWFLPKASRDFIFDRIIKLQDLFASTDRINNINVPICILHGKQDGIINVGQGICLAGRICSKLEKEANANPPALVIDGTTNLNHNCRLVILPNAGHNDICFQEKIEEKIQPFLFSIGWFDNK